MTRWLSSTGCLSSQTLLCTNADAAPYEEDGPVEGGVLEVFCEAIKDDVWTNPVKFYRAYEQMAAAEMQAEEAEEEGQAAAGGDVGMMPA